MLFQTREDCWGTLPPLNFSPVPSTKWTNPRVISSRSGNWKEENLDDSRFLFSSGSDVRQLNSGPIHALWRSLASTVFRRWCVRPFAGMWPANLPTCSCTFMRGRKSAYLLLKQKEMVSIQRDTSLPQVAPTRVNRGLFVSVCVLGVFKCCLWQTLLTLSEHTFASFCHG